MAEASRPMTDERPATLTMRERGLLADYSICRAPSGEWFALGTVRSDGSVQVRPAWMLVGTGATPDDAVTELRRQLEAESRRLTA